MNFKLWRRYLATSGSSTIVRGMVFLIIGPLNVDSMGGRLREAEPEYW
jgi:hypothetical protein